MTDHLPECADAMIPDFHNERWVCICAALRACEQRVNDEWVRDYGGHRAFALGVQAARDAVENMPAEPTWEAQEERIAALAAIDGLREKP